VPLQRFVQVISQKTVRPEAFRLNEFVWVIIEGPLVPENVSPRGEMVPFVAICTRKGVSDLAERWANFSGQRYL
jgi:hypothetical protein